MSVTSLPTNLDDDQVMELLNAFGKLKAFVLARDNSTQESRVGFSTLPTHILVTLSYLPA